MSSELGGPSAAAALPNTQTPTVLPPYLSAHSTSSDPDPAQPQAATTDPLSTRAASRPLPYHPSTMSATDEPLPAPVTRNMAAHFRPPAAHYPTAQAVPDWEEAYAAQRAERWKEKVQADLKGWRGGNGKPRSDYTLSPSPSADSYYGQPVTGTIGQHLPKEIVRVERDWSGGEVCQFAEPFPLELQGRITPAHWAAFITQLNYHLERAYSIRGAVLDNLLAVATWWTSLAWKTSTFERELRLAEEHLRQANEEVFHPAGLRALSPRDVALQFLEIE